MSFNFKETVQDLLLASVDFVSNLYNSVVCWLFHSLFNYPKPGTVYAPTAENAVFITGCSSGIGRSAALFLSEVGFTVFATVRKEKDADDLKREAKGNLVPVIVDVSNEDSLLKGFQFVSQYVKEHKLKLVSIVNNAGISGFAPMECSPDDWTRRMFDVNTFAPLRVIQLFTPLLRATQGRVVNVSSSASFMHLKYCGVYSATKVALDAMSEVMNMELSKWNVKICSIQPGKLFIMKRLFPSNALHSCRSNQNTIVGAWLCRQQQRAH
jgi:short-subunit dehydrogenase